MKNIIDDGYTEEFYIAPKAGVHGELSGTFRPMLPAQRDEIDSFVMGGRNVKEGSRRVSQALAHHVKKWSEAAPLTVDAASRLRPTLSDKLYGIIAGRWPSDPKPSEGSSQASDSEKSYLDEINPEADAKN